MHTYTHTFINTYKLRRMTTTLPCWRTVLGIAGNLQAARPGQQPRTGLRAGVRRLMKLTLMLAPYGCFCRFGGPQQRFRLLQRVSGLYKAGSELIKSELCGCFHELGFPFCVLVMRVLLFGIYIRHLIFGNSHTVGASIIRVAAKDLSLECLEYHDRDI